MKQLINEALEVVGQNPWRFILGKPTLDHTYPHINYEKKHMNTVPQPIIRSLCLFSNLLFLTTYILLYKN